MTEMDIAYFLTGLILGFVISACVYIMDRNLK